MQASLIFNVSLDADKTQSGDSGGGGTARGLRSEAPPCVNENRGQGPGEKVSHRNVHTDTVAGWPAPMAGCYLTPPSYCVITVAKKEKENMVACHRHIGLSLRQTMYQVLGKK